MGRINDPDLLGALWRVFESPHVLKLGQSFKNDLRMMIGQFKVHEINLRNYLDIADLFIDLTGSNFSALDKICLHLFSWIIRKGAE